MNREILTLPNRNRARWDVAAARVYRTALTVRGPDRRPEARDEVHDTRDSGGTGGPIGTVRGAHRQDRAAETGRPADESRGQSSLLVRDPRHLVTAVAGAPSRRHSGFQHRLQRDEVTRQLSVCPRNIFYLKYKRK